MTGSMIRFWAKQVDKRGGSADSDRALANNVFSDKRGRPNTLAPALMEKVNSIILGSRIAGTALRREDIVNIGKAVL